jgi:hypothetical protein
MAAGTESRPGSRSKPDPAQSPKIAVCESRPGRSVFLETGNTEGWIASDVTVDPVR